MNQSKSSKHANSPEQAKPWLPWLAVAIAGFCGTELRYGLSLLWPESPESFPHTTLIINLLGSLILGGFTGWWQVYKPIPWVQAALGPGLLGSFTTFSAINYGYLSLSRHDQWPLAIIYLILTIAVGMIAAAGGILLGKRLGTSRKPPGGSMSGHLQGQS